MITIVTSPQPAQPLLDLLVELLDADTVVHESADPLLGDDQALVVASDDRLLVTTRVDVDQAHAVELVEQTERTDATHLVLPLRSVRLRAALRCTLNAGPTAVEPRSADGTLPGCPPSWASA